MDIENLLANIALMCFQRIMYNIEMNLQTFFVLKLFVTNFTFKWNLALPAHVQLFSRVKSKLSFKSIICSFFFTRIYEQIIDLYIIYLVNLGRLCIQYFSNILLEDCNNSLSKLRQIMS